MSGSAVCVLLTGATGFLGTQVARQLVGEVGLTLAALVRADSQAAAAAWLARAWWDWPELLQALEEGRVEALAGDVAREGLGLPAADYARLAGRVTHIIHTAADLRVDAPIGELRRTNVRGPAYLLELARQARAAGCLRRFAHVSTAYVAGLRRGTVAEEDLDGSAGFANAYERSKFEGERVVQAARGELPITIFRPGMIVGAAGNGQIKTFNTFYFPLRLYLSGRLGLIPASPRAAVNLVPVDYVAEAVARLAFCPQAEGLTFHLTAPAGSLPQVGQLLEFTRQWAREQLGTRLPRPVFLPLPLPRARYDPQRPAKRRPAEMARAGRGRELRGLLGYVPYFNEGRQFQRANTDRLLGPYRLEWRDYLPRLLAYAAAQGFLHRTERTVHEQLLARLESGSRPVRYYDIARGEIRPVSAGEMRGLILACAGGLAALGIGPGDRVAIAGLNSTRYLALDAAIGLVGAVSVPLYYTSPPAEIDHILAASGARLLLAGAPAVLARLGELSDARLPVVCFWREPAPAVPGRQVIPWEAFLERGAGCPVPQRSPVSLGDLATLRYTSGTTGQPKGVSFSHQQLRWLGQTMSALLPWQARIRPARYLSFLPLNHVVEGILATYGAYYLPAAVSIYFLENLRELPAALPQVRPTVFFSVPRIYERIWAALAANPLGRRYMGLPDGLLKNALRGLLRRQTLRKAGLERCAQLMVGSAPCSEALLRNFRELGVEIHNAYGLTEAPLITLNRLGANRLGTVGQPLPETEVRLAEDGEVLARGPQVTAGYFGLPEGSPDQPVRGGWLHTGDLGGLTPEGSLAITGRKKELLKTAYGKYVQPGKVECLLRAVPGVAEALLAGEGRPYCAALLWAQAEGGSELDWQRLDRQVAEINRSLSHPEQVKRWAVLANDLSIEAGDLTANLKLRRGAVAQRLAAVLEGLYDGRPSGLPVLHAGQAGEE